MNNDLKDNYYALLVALIKEVSAYEAIHLMEGNCVKKGRKKGDKMVKEKIKKEAEEFQAYQKEIMRKPGEAKMIIPDVYMKELVEMLCGMAEESEEFREQILQEHKTIRRMFSYIGTKMYETYIEGNNVCISNTTPTSICVTEDPVIEYMKEYYALDDLEQVKKEEAVRLEKEKKKMERAGKKEAARTKKYSEADTDPGPGSGTGNMSSRSKKNRKKKEDPNQMNFFDLIGV